MYLHGSTYRTARLAAPETPAQPNGRTAKELRDSQLRKRLCTCGPDYCGQCRLCDYGQEWLRRHEEEQYAELV